MIKGSDAATGRRRRATGAEEHALPLPGAGDPLQIGEVAERVGLSLRTIRYYEEADLVTPSTRTPGGFRLYGETDIERLELVKRMKPLGFSLDEMRDLLQALDAVSGEPGSDAERATLDRLHDFASIAQERCLQLREQYESALQFAAMLRDRLASLSTGADGE
ncbi:MAG: MerR family transcriptional regulator [Coriobacteriia bacterium]|nr:MerR family transcriptional regulator [Coriobacteriia bacterium]